MTASPLRQPRARGARSRHGDRQRTSRLGRALSAALLLPAVLGSLGVSECRAAAPVPLDVELRARVVAPGEPVRIVARSPVPLARLEATFLGRTVFMAPAGRQEDGAETWSGWGLVDLDEQPAASAVTLLGAARSGAEVHGTLAVRVEPKEFPVEELTVKPRYVTPPKEVERRIASDREKLAEIYRRRTPAIVDTPFGRPVPGEPTGIFGARRVFNGKPRSPHSGLDLRAAEGDEVLGSGPGIVVLAFDLYYSGNTVIVDHGGGLFTLYAHLSRIDVEEGQRVEAGDRLGLVGATGRVTGPHLHWGAKIGDAPFDPRALLDAALFP